MAENFAETTRTVEFRCAVEMELAEDRGLFTATAGSAGNETGKAVELTDRFSRLQMQEITERNGKTNNVDPDVDRRWIKKPKRSGVAPLLDPDDALSTKVGLKSPLAMGVADAVRAYGDDKFLEGFYDVAWTGEEGNVAVSFKAANVIAVDHGTTGTPGGLTQAKLDQIRFLQRRRFARLTKTDRLNMAITAYEVKDLFQIDKYLNGDYRNPMLRPLENGEAVDYMGIHFIPAEIDSAANYPRANAHVLNALGQRRIPIWLNSGMHHHTWLGFEGHDDTRADLNHSQQIAGYSCQRATRLHEDKCFIVECAGT